MSLDEMGLEVHSFFFGSALDLQVWQSYLNCLVSMKRPHTTLVIRPQLLDRMP